MTATTTEHETSSAEPPDGVPISVPDEGPGTRARRQREHRRRRRLQMGVYLTTILLLTAAIPVLAYAGIRSIVDARHSGEVVRRPDQVRDPGLAALPSVPDTLAGLYLQIAPDGGLTGATVLSLAPGEEGGSVLFVPVSTLVTTDAGNEVPLAAVHAGGGPGATRGALERLLGGTFDLVVDADDGWTALFSSPAGPFSVQNPATVVVDEPGRERTRFPEGPYDLWPDNVGAFLRAEAPGETVAVKLARHEQVWTAWLAGVAANPAAAPPPYAPTDLNRYLKGLAAGQVVYATLSVTPDTTVAGPLEPLRIDPLEIRLQAARFLPGALLPVPDGRTRVRLLDGVDDQAKLEVAARRLVGAEAEIVLVGDADRFADRTEIVYYRGETKPAAAALAGALGVGTAALGAEKVEDFDVTVVVGSDFTVGVDESSTTTGSATAG